jgi:hypothetical protein
MIRGFWCQHGTDLFIVLGKMTIQPHNALPAMFRRRWLVLATLAVALVFITIGVMLWANRQPSTVEQFLADRNVYESYSRQLLDQRPSAVSPDTFIFAPHSLRTRLNIRKVKYSGKGVIFEVDAFQDAPIEVFIYTCDPHFVQSYISILQGAGYQIRDCLHISDQWSCIIYDTSR